MKYEKTTIDYWFTLEPYVYVGLTNRNVILYNTLDGVWIESNKIEIINLLRELFQKENCGVILLKDEKYKIKEIVDFIKDVREKYMGDIIDVTLSNGKPVQLLPFFNYSEQQHEIYQKLNSDQHTNVFKYLSDINIYVDTTTNITKLIPFLFSIPGIPTFSIIGKIDAIVNYAEFLSFFNQHPSPKKVLCSYTNLISLQPAFENNFSYRISVHFPMDMQQWYHSRQILLHQALPFEYVFDVSSVEGCLQAERLIEQFQIEKYQIRPKYTGDNIIFFEENVFLTKEDILSASMSIKDFFIRQSINLYDFGKISIMPNGDVFANVKYPSLGNIYSHSIYEIIHKEMQEGKSWFRIRNQSPCNNCVYQWLCPSPSDLEIAIGRPNLCHVKNN